MASPKRTIPRICHQCGSQFLTWKYAAKNRAGIYCSLSCVHQSRRKPVYGPEFIVQDCGYKTPCWTWQYHVSVYGYGRARVGGKSVPAHRMMYERYKGPIPSGLEPDHLCRNRKCVNPDHLEPVTRAVNLQRGAKARLTNESVEEILVLAATMRRIDLAERFGVHVNTINAVVRGLSWKNVDRRHD